MSRHNEMEVSFLSVPENESFARVVIAAFAVQLSPTMSEIADIKTAVSEAVTNAIVHGYEGTRGMVTMRARSDGAILAIEVMDQGKGIPNISKAMEPLYTSKPELERSGMGFAFMEAFMDKLLVESELGKGTCVKMTKNLADTKVQSVRE